MTKPVGESTFHPFAFLPQTLQARIMAFNCETAPSCASKAIKAANEKAMELEWLAMKSGDTPLACRVRSLDGPVFKPHFFKALFESQKQLACRTVLGMGRFADISLVPMTTGAVAGPIPRKPPFYSRMRFLAAEDVIDRVGKEIDYNLVQTWHAPGGMQTHILDADQNAFARDPHPYTPATAQEMRDWLNDKRHQHILDRIPLLYFERQGLTALPTEVAKCRNLRNLNLDGNHLVTLPDELAQLRSLRELFINNNSFDRVHPVLLSLLKDQGCEVNMTGNQVSELTEEVYNACFTWRHWLGMPFDHDDLGRSQEFGFCSIWNQAPEVYGLGYIAIGKNELKKIPFALWLREKLTLPNIAYLFAESEFLKNNLSFEAYQALTVLFLFFMGIIGIPTWLINQFLSLVVVPIATFVRDKLGYGRMISIKP